MGQLAKIKFTPGVIREVTNYTNAGGWYMADKVRFRQGNPEKMGGWTAVTQVPFQGTCRHIHQWSDLESDRYIALGTSSHLYIFWGEQYYDITPIRATFPSLANPFTTGGPSGELDQATVTIPNHGPARAGDFVNFTGATTGLDAFTADQLNQQFRIVSAPDADHIVIQLPSALTAVGATGGGPAVTASFLISSGLEDAQPGQGWGMAPWGGQALGMPTMVGWGEPFDNSQLYPADPTVVQMRIWDIDNFGQDLVANIRGGPIYYWHRDAGLESPAKSLSDTVTVNGVTFTPDGQQPIIANQILVSPNDQHLIAFGCNDINQTKQDMLLVRWSNASDAYTWMPLRTNDAGGMRLGAGSFIIAAMRTASTILIWTDLGLWTMTYIGQPYIFGFQEIAEGLSLIGPNAMINIGTAVLWMDRGIFYGFTGQVQELPCTLKDYVFSDLNYTQAYKIYCGHNHAFSEVFWFYPSASSTENNRYVVYNYAEQLWSMGSLCRTAWLDMGRNSYPVATHRNPNLLYYHEFGDDAGDQPMTCYVDSADMDLNGGESYIFLTRFMPDILFRGKGDQQEVGVTIFGRSAPLEHKKTLARIQVTPHTGQTYIRVRERQISIRIESATAGTGWRLGTVRTDWAPDGRR